MLATTETRLTTFNTLALHYQDDAYTLAYYLLGDESCAERATQAAFDYLYQHAGLSFERFRLEILRRVLEHCQKKAAPALRLIPHTAVKRLAGSHDATLGKLLALKYGERSVVILVDVLGLNYEEAAQVIGSSMKQVSHLLAQARQQML
jgi:DNA-directed RNA polymerase specialized sigma24 family protein